MDPDEADAIVVRAQGLPCGTVRLGIEPQCVSMNHMGAGKSKNSSEQTDPTNVTRLGGHGGPVDA